MKRLLCAVGILTLSGSLVLVSSATAQSRGCIDVLVDCNSSSSVLETVCGPAPQAVPPNIASFVRFGPGVQSVLLTQCGTGATTVITGDTDLCGLPGWNDQLCQVQIIPGGAPAPVLNTFGLTLLFLLLSACGLFALQRQALEQVRRR